MLNYIVSSEFPPGPGGIGRHAYDLANALAGKGVEVTVFTPQDYASTENISVFNAHLHGRFKVVTLERKGVRTPLVRVKEIQKALKQTLPDRMIVTGRFALWLGGMYKRLYGDKLRVEAFIHGTEVMPAKAWQRKLTHNSLKQVDKIWSVSNFTTSLLPKKLRSQLDIGLLPNGIIPASWPDKNTLTPLEWGGNPKLLTVGNVTPRKGQHRMIKALPEIIEKFPEIHYHIVGLPTNQEKLEQKAKQLGVTDHITFHGRLPGDEDLARAYATADVFCMLSENQASGDVEGFGIAILEANYFGVPAIGAKGCGIEDAIKPGFNGELVDGNNAQEIGEALEKILNNYQFYSENAKKWAMQHDWNELVKKVL